MSESRIGQTDDAAVRGNGESPFKLSLNDVTDQPAPVERVSDPNPNANGGNGAPPWRAGWGRVAPAAQDLPPVDPRMDGPDPNANNPNQPWRRQWGEVAPPANPGNNGDPPWRANPAPAPGAPGGDNPAPGNPGNPGNPGGDGVPDWKDWVEKNRQPEPGPWLDPNGGGRPPGAPGGPLDANQHAIIDSTLRPKTSVTGFLYTGGITGGSMYGGMYLMDARLLSTPEAERSGLMRLWERVSPAHAALKQHTDAVTLATQQFSERNAAYAYAQRQLDLVKNVPEDLVASAEARLVTLRPAGEAVTLVTAQRNYLRNIATVSNADDIAKVVGPAGSVGRGGVLFEEGSAIARDLQSHAAQLRARASGGAINTTLFDGHIAALETRLSSMSGTLTELGTIQARLEFFKKGLAGNPSAVEAVLGTADEVAAGQKLFVRGTAEADNLVLYATRSQAHAESANLLSGARGAMASKEAALAAAKERGAGVVHGSLGGATLRGFAKGLGVSAATLAAGYGTDYLLGQQFGYKPSHDGMGRFLLDGVAVPAILLSNMQPRTKVWMAGLTFAGARTADYFSSTGASAEMSMLLRPNTIDAVGVTASALAPIPGKYKAIGIASTLAIGRGWNAFARATGLDGYNGSAGALDEELQGLRNMDTISPSVTSFDRAVQKAKDLGVKNPAQLERRLSEALNRTNLHLVEKERESAMLSYALGLSRLELGSRLDVTDYSPNAYFLQGTKVDFGGTAAEQMNSAVSSLEIAHRWASAHRGESVGGRVIDDAYVRQLEELRAKVVADLNVIYGEHDMDQVYTAVQGLCRTKVQSVMQFIIDGNAKLRSLGPNLNATDQKYVAKMARDLAIAGMAYAEQCANAGNGEDARTFFAAAEQHLRNSEAIEPGSRNLIRLKQIADRVKAKIPGAVGDQWNNRFNNPLQLNPGR